jgi:phospholipid/cholesterol/gamma-HCH transport system substrate-binding protein
MTGRREQILVGSFVLVVAAALIATVLAVSGALTERAVSYRAYFKFASGVTPGAAVRYGGLEAGRIDKLFVDPADSTRIQIDFSVGSKIPIKRDSIAKITFLGALGEPYLEVTTGGRGSPLAPPGSVLQSREIIGIPDIAESVSSLIPVANQVMNALNDRLGEMKSTLAHVNELTGDENRRHIKELLAGLNATLAEVRPVLTASLADVRTTTKMLPGVATDVQTATAKLSPLIDNLQGTLKQANETMTHIDAIAMENRPDIRAVMANTRLMLDSVSDVVEALNRTVDRNTDNLNETLSNVRVVSVNMQELTDSLKRKPSLLVRGETGKDRKPGDNK